MREYAVSQFKAHALAIINGIAETGETVLITKRGKPMARVEPAAAAEDAASPGRLAGTITFEGDLIAPLGDAAAPPSHREGQRR